FVGLTPDKKTKLQNRVSAVEMLMPGDTFFKEGLFEGRFKFIGIEDRQIRIERTGLTQYVKIAIYEDLKPEKKGMRYESQAGLPDAELEAKAYYDRTAILKSGEREFRVEEYTKFRLPDNASKKEHFLKKVTPQGVTIETVGADGKVITREIPKGTP
ncbi:MAG TPA: Amuc_1099 family pilus-like system protein, partial [Haloferula sp.]